MTQIVFMQQHIPKVLLQTTFIMKKLSFIFAFCLITLTAYAALAQTTDSQKPYSGEDATGANVLALWQFDAENPTKDASGKGHTLQVRGKDTRFVNAGKWGGGLTVESKAAPGDTRQGVGLKDPADLNLDGAFTIELWFSPSEQALSEEHKYLFLVDKKYYPYQAKAEKANKGYMILLLPADNHQFKVQAQLGFGNDSAIIDSAPQTFEAAKWYHIAFTYDGKGDYNFYLNNINIGNGHLKDRGSIAPSTYRLTIGDREGSLGHRFLGHIDEVRILNVAKHFLSGKVLLSTEGQRTAFYRMEKDAKIRMRVFNDRKETLTNAVLNVGVDNMQKAIQIPNVDAGKSTFVDVPLDTSLRPANYQLNISVQDAQQKTIGNDFQFPMTVVPRPLPNHMPIIMWGHTGDYQELADIGYTAQLVYMPVSAKFWEQIWDGDLGEDLLNDPRTVANRKELDEMLALQLNGMLKPQPGRYAGATHPDFNRKNQSGKKQGNDGNVDGLYPRVQKFAHDTGAATAKMFGDLPGWTGTLIDSEVRDRSIPSYNEIDVEAYKKFSGQEIPAAVGGARGIDYKALPQFPVNHIIPDDDPILQYYKWFWKKGDGWNQLFSAVHHGIKSTEQQDTFTWFDPAVRAPSLWGSGGDVDFLNQWTYSYPNPLRVGLAADELFAMAEGKPGQKVMNMIQTIWKRTELTNWKPEQPNKLPKGMQETEWEKKSPKAKYISIAPDHLSEGTWLEFARPIKAIANHGWGSLGKELGDRQGSYDTTNVEARKRMTYLLHNVIKPLSPTMMQVPDYKTDVAFLQSFTSQIFAGRGTYGWGRGWGADSFMLARYAGLQPDIVYEETILQRGLDQYKVLFMTDCDVLPQSVADAIEQFQKKGGLVIGDENLASGILPDIMLSRINRGKPDVTKQQLIQSAQKLSDELQPFYRQQLHSSNPDVITRLRQFGDSYYVFTVNDNRTYGDYLGQYGKVMEKGLSSKAEVSINTLSDGAVYDLMNHKQVTATKEAGTVQFPVSLEGGQGNVFLVTPRPIGKLWITAPSDAQRGKTSQLKVQLNDDSGANINAVIPMTITITDPDGRKFEKSGYYGAAKGRVDIDLDIASNDEAGTWKVEVVEALTGEKVTADFTVQ